MSTAIVDLRSDTVTQPTRPCARPWPRRRWATTCSATTPASTRCRRRSRRCSASRRRCSCRPARRATCARAVALPARRRVHRRPDAALLPLGRRRRGGVRQRAAAAAGPPAGRHARAGRHRGGDQAGRSAFRAHPAAGAGEHAGRQGAAVGIPAAGDGAGAVARALRRHLDGARLFNAAVAQAAGDRQRPARARRAASRHCSTASRSASARAWARPSARRCAARAN